MSAIGHILRSKWLVILLFIVVFVILAFIVVRQWDALVAFPWRLHPIYLFLALGFHSIALGVTFVVWHLMVAKLADFGNLRVNFRFYYLSTLAKRIPSAVWYVGGRIGMYQQVNVPIASVANVIVLEPTILGLSGVLTLLCLMPFYSELPTRRIFPVAGAGIVGLIILLMRPQLLADLTNWLLSRFGASRLVQVPTRYDLMVWLAIYVLPWLFAGVSMHYAIRAFTQDIHIRLVDAIGISTVAMLVSLVSMILPGGMGLKELTAGALLTPWMPFTSALVVTIAYRLMQTINEIIWALLATCVRMNDNV